jgi:hypothetical protein
MLSALITRKVHYLVYTGAFGAVLRMGIWHGLCVSKHAADIMTLHAGSAACHDGSAEIAGTGMLRQHQVRTVNQELMDMYNLA